MIEIIQQDFKLREFQQDDFVLFQQVFADERGLAYTLDDPYAFADI